MSEIKFRCPVCNQKIGVTDGDAGRDFSCPVCLSQLVIPSQSDEPVRVLARGGEKQGAGISVIPPTVAVPADQPLLQQGASVVAPKDSVVKRVPSAMPPPPPPGAAAAKGLRVAAQPPAVPSGARVAMPPGKVVGAPRGAAVPHPPNAEALQVAESASFASPPSTSGPPQTPSAAAASSGPDVSERLAAELEESREQIGRLRERFHELESENARMENEIRETGEERKRSQLRWVQVQDELKWQVAKLTQESAEMRKASQLAEARASHAEQELGRYKQEERAATQELGALREELRGVSLVIEGLRRELAVVQSNLDCERRKLREVGERFAISERERVELQRQIPAGPASLPSEGGLV